MLVLRNDLVGSRRIGHRFSRPKPCERLEVQSHGETHLERGRYQRLRLDPYFGRTDTGSICARISPDGFATVWTFTYVRPSRISASSESMETPVN